MYIIHHYNLLFLYNLYNNIDLFHIFHHNFCNEYFFFSKKVKLTFPQIINTIIKINLRSNILLFIFYSFPLLLIIYHTINTIFQLFDMYTIHLYILSLDNTVCIHLYFGVFNFKLHCLNQSHSSQVTG